ncbi:putative phage-type endonuclease [Mycetocola sp. BIGb0189]|uniref:YqaJ viral recombinase family nuclease n=1 Tax=Mycetocola sp. BIGb0189 TaxID=2940604 RepID=UPI002167CED6|nr:YqaJ viral recombinase family protein [Mycetocola sp. BIGb0189]MCS4277390.1 putative phage-type endonuclease [Mycetocola sp. BIGb0189]
MTELFVRIDAPSNTPEWLAARKAFLGASEVACVLGLSKWSTPLGIYLDKLSPDVSDSMNEQQELGHVLEPAVAEMVERRTGMKVLPSPGLVQSLVYAWLGATPDRVNALGEPVELKTSNAHMKHDWADGPPIIYRIQVLVQMIVLGKKRGHLAVIHGDFTFEYFVIEWDQDAVDLIIEKTREFWHGHVVPRIAPDPVVSDEAALAFPNPDDLIYQADEDMEERHGAFGLLIAEKKEIEITLEAHTLRITQAMGEKATAVVRNGRPLFTWESKKARDRFDLARFKQDHPDLADEYTITGQRTRSFKYKPIKEKK